MADAPLALAGLRVLLVEDRYYVAEEMRHSVERLGGEVMGPVGNVAGALALIAAALPDLALLDVGLDDDLVYPVAEELRQSRTPFIFATGYESWIIDPRFQDAPAVRKPMTDAALAAAVRQLGV